MLEGRATLSRPAAAVTTTSPSVPVGMAAMGTEVTPVPITSWPAESWVPINVLCPLVMTTAKVGKLVTVRFETMRGVVLLTYTCVRTRAQRDRRDLNVNRRRHCVDRNGPARGREGP